jgi:serine protease Do/serine protease DegQ
MTASAFRIRAFLMASLAAAIVLMVVGQAPAQQGMRPTFGAAIIKALPSVVGIRVLSAEPIEESNPFYAHPAALSDGADRPKTRTRTAGSTGSGVIIAASGEAGTVITNFHVIENATRIGVRLYDGRSYEAKLVGRDAATDIAVLAIEAPGLTPIHVGSATPVKVGDLVLAVGAPFGLDSTATLGMVSSLFRSSVNYRQFEGYIQHDAAVNPGNSGGALVDVDGDLIGINTAITSPSGGSVGLSFAQPIGLAMKIAEQIIRYGGVWRGGIGVASTDVTSRLMAEKRLNLTQGAIITAVAPGSAAQRAGLKIDDVVVEAGVHRSDRLKMLGNEMAMVPIISRRSLEAVIGIHAVGDRLQLKYHRGNEVNIVEVVSDPIVAKTTPIEAPNNLVRLRGLIVSSIGPEHEKFGEFNGVIVVEVKPKTMSEFSGFLPGDIITEIRGRTIRVPEDLFETAASGDDAPEIKLWRGSTPVRFKLPF